MYREDFTKGISPAGGRRLEPAPHMESPRARVKSAVPRGHTHAGADKKVAAGRRTKLDFYR